MNRLKEFCCLILCLSMIALTGCNNTEQNIQDAEKQKNDYLSLAFDSIDKIISADIENGFTSAQLAVMKDGKLVYENSWGLTNSYNEDGTRITEGNKVTKDTLFDLASNTKMYSIVYAVQYLVSDGKMNIDTKIIDILGDEFADLVLDLQYENGDKISHERQIELRKNITVRDVLSHQAGFPSSMRYFDSHYDVTKLKANPNSTNVLYQGENPTHKDILTLICKTPLFKEPGGEPLYSDIDYMLMTYVIEKITSEPLDSFLKKTFYEPLGLNNITYKPLENGFDANQISATELHGNTRDFYQEFDGIRKYTLQGEVHDECAYYSMKGVSGNAGLFSSATDLAKLCSLMIDGTYNGKRYFSENVINEFTAPISEMYAGWGIGWWRHGEGGQRENYFSSQSSYNTFGHQGWTGTLTMIDRKNNLIMVLLTNKINTPVTNITENPDKFDGKWFTTSYLEFAAPIIYAGLFSQDEDSYYNQVDSLLELWIKDAKDEIEKVENISDNHPAKHAYNAILKAKDLIKQATITNLQSSTL